MTVEPGEAAPWVRLNVVKFYRRFDYDKFGSFNGVLALLDRVVARLFHPHYHFLTADRELCGYRLQDGDGMLQFLIPDAKGGVPLNSASRQMYDLPPPPSFEEDDDS